MIKFEKIEEKYFISFLENTFDYNPIKDIFSKIKLPKRATSGSAGYDFFSPFSFELSPGQSIVIPTGIRAKMPSDVVLTLFPKSGQGFKYKIQLANTVGIVDSDFYNSDNGGHILVKLVNDNNEGKTLSVEQGKAFCQGIFMNYLVCDDDDSTGVRNGGFGSTNS